VTAASITQTQPRARVGTSPIAKIAAAAVGLAATVTFAAAAILFLSLVFGFPVTVPVDNGEAIGAPSHTWWWFDVIGAFLTGAVAVAAVVETIRLVVSAE
jgi:hypothetical protein